jgi:CTP:molybdopterin cytidylyltransferase MocA
VKIAGLVLAAGAGRRMGMPKALVTDGAGTPWVVSAARTLSQGGCDEVLVTVGAQADDVQIVLLSTEAEVVRVDGWHEGVSASLAAGLAAVLGSDADACLVHLVDLPDVGADVVARVIAAGSSTDLCRASFDGRPGHPVLIGRRHWLDLLRQVAGDNGANDYLVAREALLIECSDLATGSDVDHRP